MYSTDRFQINVAYLSKYFDDLNNMTSTIIRIEVENPYTDFSKLFGDPAKEQTLQICDDDSIMLFYKKDDKCRTPKRVIMKGVTVLTTYNYKAQDTVRVALPPAILPAILEKNIFHDITQSFNRLKLTQDEMFEEFLNKYYVSGDMTSLYAMTRKNGWQRSFRNGLDVKIVSVCKSCRKKALKGCCNEYNAANRTTVSMVLGWMDK